MTMPKMNVSTLEEHREFWNSIQDYEKEVFSVFKGAQDNPLFPYLEKQRKDSHVAYLGVGSGSVLPYLSKRFRKVTAVDFAQNLLVKAQKRYASLGNVSFENCNFVDMRRFHKSFDIAISVNSLLPPSIKDKNAMVKEHFKILRPGGKFVGILPSADVVVYLQMLDVEWKMKQGMTEKEAIVKSHSSLEDRNFHPFGFYQDHPGFIIQKYWYPFEIQLRFKDAGFTDVSLEKLYYSWTYCRRHHYGYFPSRERIWDWFVTTKRPS